MAGQRSAGRHRAPSAAPRRRGRPRRRPWGLLGTSAAVTGVAVVSSLGLLTPTAETSTSARIPLSSVPEDPDGDARSEAASGPGRRALAGPSTTPLAVEGAVAATSESTRLPAASGTGRRVVFSEGRQRVWLVGADGSVVRTYLVSGSVYDNLDPGRYEVFSRSRDAVGVDDSGTMEYFVRFTYGDQGAAIGFHTIPVDEGRPVQTVAQLGTPLSHGCVRQRRSDAVALWEFAPLGTRVVVTA